MRILMRYLWSERWRNAVFKAVNVIDKNKEYSIVTKGREYSLAKYDHIVLDHTTVKDDDIVN